MNQSSASSLIVAVGDKCGQIGICSLESLRNNSTESAPQTYQFRPHSSPINALLFSSDYTSAKLYSASYDGTVRVLDMEKKVFEEVYRNEDGDLCKSIAFQSKDTLLVPLHSGDLIFKDIRKKGHESFNLCKGRLRTVDVHPISNNYFVSARYEGVVDIWDLRMIRNSPGKTAAEPLTCLPFGKSVSSAYFSPLTGNRILASSMDDIITVFQTENSTMEAYQRLCAIKHNNHVGRWLTNIRPIWHPKNENVFLSGSMQQPRVVEAWNLETINGGQALSQAQAVSGIRVEADCLLGGLTSVCSVLAVHDTVPVICGVNSSGYAHVWI